MKWKRILFINLLFFGCVSVVIGYVYAQQQRVSQIAFASNMSGNWEIYLIDSDGKNPINLTNNPAADYYPAWSPDGKKIAFSSMRDGDLDIYVMDVDGNNPISLNHNDVDDAVPSWSPDGANIAFQFEQDGKWTTCVMDADGSNKRMLTSSAGWDTQPKWSPIKSNSHVIGVSKSSRRINLWGMIKRKAY